MHISLVPTDHIDEIWPRVKKHMERAAEYTYGRLLAEDIKDNLTAPDTAQQLWIAFDKDKIYGAGVTEIIEFPRLKTLTMHFVGGDEFKKWGHKGLETFQNFAKDNNCDVIESYGRPGWEKMWKNDGYVSRYTLYELPVGKQK